MARLAPPRFLPWSVKCRRMRRRPLLPWRRCDAALARLGSRSVAVLRSKPQACRISNSRPRRLREAPGKLSDASAFGVSFGKPTRERERRQFPGKPSRFSSSMISKETRSLHARRPLIEQRRRVGLHKLETSIPILLDPAIDVTQTLRQHPSLFPEALVNARLAARPKSLEHHVFHRPFTSPSRDW